MASRPAASRAAGLPDQLFVLLGGEVAGVVARERRDGPLTFTYDDAWRRRADAYPLSLSLPLAGRSHSGQRVAYYLRGLLSDDPARLARIAARHGVSPSDAFALLAHIGEDCPGAVQFARPERVAALLGAAPGRVSWLSDAEVAEQLRALGADQSGLGLPEDEGQFSLPGALAKIALRWDPARKRWGRPSGRAATTHILKPPRAGVPFHCENEHLCLELARELGLPAARSAVLAIEDQVALVVERYDREVTGRAVRRIHQEDMSQALGADPELKYVAQGAPTLREMIELLRSWSSSADDPLRLVQAVALNWVIVGTDAHPRNYSVLIRPGTRVSLAPFYDIASALFVTRRSARADPEERQLAMAVDGRVIVGNIDRSAWEAEARSAGLRPARVLDAVHAIVAGAPAAAERVVARAVEEGEGIDEGFATKFLRGVRGQAELRVAALGRG